MAQPPSGSSAAKVCRVRPVRRSPRVLRGVFESGLYGAAPEWFGWRPRIFELDLCGAAPECVGWRPRFMLFADESKGESLFLKSLY